MVKGKAEQDVSADSGLKYEVAKSRELGRYLIAAKNLVAGEVIFRENPIVVGPAAFFEGSFCFNCLKSIVITKVKDFRCTKCNVALLCQPTCELVPGYHGNVECKLFGENQSCMSEISQYSAVILLPLRMWLFKKFQPEIWATIDQLEDHVKERRNTSVWEDRSQNVVQVLQKLRSIADDDETSNLLQRLCGILDVNSFELRSPDDSDNHLLRGIYPRSALMAHDCRGNTHLTVDDEHRLTIYASMSIKKDGIISFNYTGSFLGTAERRENLRCGKYFECKCTLCSDPCELGSHLSSLVCPRCRRGYIVTQNPLIIDPYTSQSKWECECCKSLLSGKLVKTTLDLLCLLIDDSQDSNPKLLETLLGKLLLTIHPNHYLAIKMKQNLLAVYKREMLLVHPQKKFLERMLNLYKEVLTVLDITEPGISRLKGITLYEMHLPMVILANKNYTAREISTLELVSKLEEAEKLLRKALSNLLLEPVATPEGRLAKRALHELKLLRQNITDVKALPTDV